MAHYNPVENTLTVTVERGDIQGLLRAAMELIEMAEDLENDAQRTHNSTDRNQLEKPSFAAFDLALEPDHTAVIGRNKGCMVFGEVKEPAVPDCEVCVEDYGDRCPEPTCPCVKDKRREP